MKSIVLVASLVIFGLIFMPKWAGANVSGTVGQSGASSQATSGVTTTTVPTTATVPVVTPTATAAPVVVTVPTTTQTLPVTGLSPAAYLLIGLVPFGISLLSYKRAASDENSPFYLWQNRQFKF